MQQLHTQFKGRANPAQVLMPNSVSEATATKAECLIVAINVAVATAEVQVPSVGTAALRTAPIVAVRASVVQ